MTLAAAERAATNATATSGTTHTAGTTSGVVGGGKLYVLASAAIESSLAIADPTIANDGSQHGATDWAVVGSQEFQGAALSHRTTLLESSNYTATADAIALTWTQTTTFRAAYVFEVTGTGVGRFIQSWEGTTAQDLLGQMNAGMGRLLLQAAVAYTGALTLTGLAHMATGAGGTVLENVDAGGAAVCGFHCSYRAGLMVSPTVGGRLSAAPASWALFGLLFYEGATPTPPAVVSATGARVGGTSPLSAGDIGTEVAGNLDLIFRALKPSTALCSAIAAGTQQDFTNVQTVTGGTAAAGNDVGATRACLDQRTMALPGDVGDVTGITQTNTPNSCHVWRMWLENKIQVDGGWSLASTTGDDATHGTGRSATGAATIAFQPDDILLAFSASDTDTVTMFTDADLTAAGVTFGATVELLGAGGIGTGQDTGTYVHMAIVESGTATVAPALALAGGPSSCGATVFLRARALGTAGPVTVTANLALPGLGLAATIGRVSPTLPAIPIAHWVVEDVAGGDSALYADDFARPNSDDPGQWLEGQGDWDLSGNGLIQTNANTVPGLTIYESALTADDYWVEGELLQSDGSGQIGVLARFNAAGLTGWSMEVADGAFKLIEAIDGEPAGTVATGAAHTHTTGEVYRVEVQGNAIRFYLNNSLVLSHTSSSYVGNRYVGFHINESSSGAVKWGNFRAGLLPWSAAGSDAVTSWPDRISGRLLTNPGTAPQYRPTGFGELDGPHVEFGAGTDNSRLTSVGPVVAQPLTQLMVMEWVTTTGTPVAIDDTDSTQCATYSPTDDWALFAGTAVAAGAPALDTPYIFASGFDGAASYLWVNNANVIAAGNPGANGLSGGVSVGGRYDGNAANLAEIRVAEIIIYDRKLSAGELTTVWNHYLENYTTGGAPVTVTATVFLPGLGQAGTLTAASTVTANLALPGLGLVANLTASATVAATLSLPGLGVAATLTAASTVTGNLSLPGLGLAANLAAQSTVTGNLGLPGLGLSASLTAAASVTANLGLPGLGLSATVDVGGAETVTANLQLPGLGLSASLTASATVTGNLALPGLGVAATLTAAATLTGALSLPGLGLSGTLTARSTVTANLQLPGLGTVGHLTASAALSGVLGLPGLGITGTIEVAGTAALAANLALPGLGWVGAISVGGGVIGAIGLPGLGLTATIDVREPGVVGAILILPGLGLTATVEVGVGITGAVTLPGLTVAAVLTVGDAVFVDIAANLSLPGLKVAARLHVEGGSRAMMPFGWLVPAMNNLLEMVQALLPMTYGGPVARVGLQPGEPVWDECCDGLLYATWERIYSAAAFPIEDQAGGAITFAGSCGPGVTPAIDLLVGLVRCAPVPQNNGQPPTPPLMADFAMVMAEDGLCLTAAADCWLREIVDLEHVTNVMFRGTTPLGPEGGCQGVEARLTIGLDMFPSIGPVEMPLMEVTRLAGVR